MSLPACILHWTHEKCDLCAIFLLDYLNKKNNNKHPINQPQMELTEIIDNENMSTLLTACFGRSSLTNTHYNIVNPVSVAKATPGSRTSWLAPASTPARLRTLALGINESVAPQRETLGLGHERALSSVDAAAGNGRSMGAGALTKLITSTNVDDGKRTLWHRSA